MTLLFKLIKLIRVIKTWFTGNKPWEEMFKLFKLDGHLSPEQLCERLIPYCYQYNYMGACYHHQIFQARRLVDSKYQIHLRFYKSGWITGHYELQPEVDLLGHLWGEDLRELTFEEKREIRHALLGAIG